ncbi:MAG TPA: hypothetical protein EYO76_12405, partial [Flavobacteriaceae bacterium]|nr:hypothetical protein [Flavobacteriaceae bacterium]
MKQYKYFGDFNNLNFYNLNDNDKFKVFISKSYFKKSLRLKQTGFKQDKKELGLYINYIEILNTVHEFFPNNEVGEEIYDFLIDKYSAGIGADNVFFIQKFRDQTFGLDHFESKKYAINHFKSIFKLL